MALSTVVFVGESKEWIPELVSRASKLKVTSGFHPEADLGPMITPEAKLRCESLIQSGIDEGAACVLDGRGLVVKGYENGNFVGPTILCNVETSMKCYK